MKKIIGLLMCVLITGSAVAMDPFTCASEEEVAWSLSERSALIVAVKEGDYAAVKRALLAGADPNETDVVLRWPALEHAVVCERDDLVELLLVYGANPTIGKLCDYEPFLRQSERPGNVRIIELLRAYGADSERGVALDAPIAWVDDLKTLQLLVRAGANINAVAPAKVRTTALINLTAQRPCNTYAIVWALTHRADPNIGPAADCADFELCFAFHNVLARRNIAGVIALLQHRARLDVTTRCWRTPLVLAEELMRQPYSDAEEAAQHGLLKAVSESKLNPCRLYTVHELERIGILHDNAVLIEQAMREVYDAHIKCALDDIEYRHGKQGISEYLLNRQIGFAGKHKK